MYMHLSHADYLRVYPNATGLNPNFETIDAWLQANYKLVEPSGINIAGYRLWKCAGKSLRTLR